MVSGRGNDYWPKDELIAAALLQIEFDWPDGTRGPIMDHDTARTLTAAQIISLFDKDHWPKLKVNGGPNVFWNCTWRPKQQHRIKTATQDIPALRKGDRIHAQQAEFRRSLLAKAGQAEAEPPSEPHKFKRRWPSRPFPKQHRPMRRAR